MLRILHSRNVAEADTEEAVVVVVPMEAEEEVASTVVVEAAASMEAVLAAVVAVIAEAADRTEATAVGRQAQAEAWALMGAGPAGMRHADTAARVRTE